MSEIIYNDFINNKRILHSDTITNYNDALRFFIENENNADIVTCDINIKFLLLSIGILMTDENNNYYYEYNINRHFDIIDDITCNILNSNINIKKTYYIGGILYDPNIVKEFILCSAMYHSFVIRITFLEKPTNDLEFSIKYKGYLINSEDRKKLAINKIITKSNIYYNGMCSSNNIK